jgi:hypothetical protein
MTEEEVVRLKKRASALRVGWRVFKVVAFRI